MDDKELVEKWRAKSVSARHIQQSVLRRCAAELETVLNNQNGMPNPAAAQELLDALEMLLTIDVMTGSDAIACRKQARSAIAKATTPTTGQDE